MYSQPKDNDLKEYHIVVCQNCGAKNKIPSDKISLGPRCGRCKTALELKDNSGNDDQKPSPSDSDEKEKDIPSSSNVSNGGRSDQEEFLIIGCQNCGARNKIPRDKVSLGPKCGRCKKALDCNIKAGQASGASGRPSDLRAGGPSGTSPQTEKTLGIGDLISGRYKIQDILGGEGKSAMGVVYVCHDYESDQVMALKTLQKRYLDSKKVMDSFKKEALAWIHLEKHPNIVRAFWARELDHRMFIACEFISPDSAGRTSLTPHLKRPFSLKRTLTWALQFCHGMEYACSKGVTPHRDIKPDNILITVDGDVKITDFGLVGLWDKTDRPDEIKALMEKNQKGLTFLTTHNNRIVAGSPPWMAPEQFFGISKTASDIYSFGIVLFQMVNNGELPFQPKKGDRWANAHKIYPLPRVPHRGKTLEQVIVRCLQKRRDKRYADFAELRIDLEEIFKKEITKQTGEGPPAPPVVEELRDWERINKGMSFANLGLIDEAIKQYQEGLKKDPENSIAHYNLGNALLQKGRIGEAIRHYKEAIKTDPNMKAAYFNLGMAFMKKGLTDEAIKYYKGALKLDPVFAEAYVNLGVAYSADGMSDEAIKSYREAIRCKPDFAEAHLKLGLAFFKKGLIDESISALGKAAGLKSGYADAYYNLGIAFIKKGWGAEAARAFEEFIASANAKDGRIEKAKGFIEKLKKRP